MPNRVSCQNCGAGIDLPGGYSRSKIRCPGCGYYAEVPADLRSAFDDDDEPVGPPKREPDPPARARRAEPVRETPPPEAESTPGRRRAPGGYDVDAEETYSFADPLPPPPPPAPPVARPRTRREPPRVRPQANPRDHRPTFEPEEGVGRPLLPGTREEDDDRPYAVPGTGLINCPTCKGELPIDSTLCVHCGRDLASGEKAGRTYQPIEAEWEEGWPFHVRLSIFAGLQVLNFVFMILGVVSDGSYELTSLFTHGFFQAFHSALQAFLLGSYDTLSLKRTHRGQTTMTRTRRILFYKLPPEKINWRESHGVGIVGSADPGLFAWLICLYLALLCLLPGVVFYFMVIRPERFQVNLCDEYGSTDVVVFHSKSREQAHEVASLVGEATGLWYKPVL